MSCRQILAHLNGHQLNWLSFAIIMCFLYRFGWGISCWLNTHTEHGTHSTRHTLVHKRGVSLSSRMRVCCGFRVKGHGFMNEQTLSEPMPKATGRYFPRLLFAAKNTSDSLADERLSEAYASRGQEITVKFNCQLRRGPAHSLTAKESNRRRLGITGNRSSGE